MFLILNNKNIPRDNADMSNDKEHKCSPKAYGTILNLRPLSYLMTMSKNTYFM